VNSFKSFLFIARIRKSVYLRRERRERKIRTSQQYKKLLGRDLRRKRGSLYRRSQSRR
jgi:hypothetical protein